MTRNWRTIVAWSILLLGVGHTVTALVTLWQPLCQALHIGPPQALPAGEVRVAVWFTLFGPVLALVGHLTVRMAAAPDPRAFRLTGGYLAATALIGMVALPGSPFWVLFILALALVAGTYSPRRGGSPRLP